MHCFSKHNDKTMGCFSKYLLLTLPKDSLISRNLEPNFILYRGMKNMRSIFASMTDRARFIYSASIVRPMRAWPRLAVNISLPKKSNLAA